MTRSKRRTSGTRSGARSGASVLLASVTSPVLVNVMDSVEEISGTDSWSGQAVPRPKADRPQWFVAAPR